MCAACYRQAEFVDAPPCFPVAQQRVVCRLAASYSSAHAPCYSADVCKSPIFLRSSPSTFRLLLIQPLYPLTWFPKVVFRVYLASSCVVSNLLSDRLEGGRVPHARCSDINTSSHLSLRIQVGTPTPCLP